MQASNLEMRYFLENPFTNNTNCVILSLSQTIMRGAISNGKDKIQGMG